MVKVLVGYLDPEDLPVKGDADADGWDHQAHGRGHCDGHLHAILAEALGHPNLVEQDQALPPAAGAGDGTEDDFRGLVPHTECAGTVGGRRGGLAEGVVEEDTEVPELRADLPHQDIGAVVREGVAGAVEGVVVRVTPAAAGAFTLIVVVTRIIFVAHFH
ncbi:hypothetical protein NP173_23775 [Salmonella enterica]|nr:hypothetical protein [Salmonella enterica]